MPNSFHGPSESFLEGQAAPGGSTSWQEVILLFWVYPPKANTLIESPAAEETPLTLLSISPPTAPHPQVSCPHSPLFPSPPFTLL